MKGMVTVMTMGEYIKQLRKNHDLTQEELGKKLDPPVNRAAINKWETGQVENIKRSYIEQMSKLFDIRPSELMCFDIEHKLSEEVITIEMVQKNFGRDAVRMLELFTKLNALGKDKALEDLEDLSNLPKYSDE